jgi:hypothetical protein
MIEQMSAQNAMETLLVNATNAQMETFWTPLHVEILVLLGNMETKEFAMNATVIVMNALQQELQVVRYAVMVIS